MALRYLQEVTDWGDKNIPNHIYIMNGRLNVGYIKASGGEPFMYKNGASKNFSRTHRKFKELKNYEKLNG
jgi:hypothetical protein